jgi:fatty-acyl-CoA synthase
MSPAPGLTPAFDPLRFWGRLDPGRTALVERREGRRWSYAGLDREADRWAALLAALGARRGDRVAALAGNRAELVHLLFACGRLGCALVPLNWRLPPAELAPVLADAAPAVLLGESRFRAAAERAAALAGTAVRWVDLDAEAPALLAGAGLPPAARPVEAEEPWLVLYTSGSTGTPKGAMLPFRQVFHNALATATGWALGPDEVAPVSTPLFHTGAWNVFATPLWFRGGTVVLFEGFDPADFLDGLAREGCTLALTVPTQLLMLTEAAAWGRELPRLRHFISGGAPCPAPLAERVRASGYRFREGYGLTECGPNCFATTDRLALERPGSVGHPVPLLETRLVDPAGADVGPGEAGELLLRGPQRFAGYLNRPDLTAEALVGGWLRTGDLARRDADGVFTICGRRKEMYISGGENVFPGEVEAALAELPGVAEAVVVGVPDARWGEVGRAFVVARLGAALSEAEVLAHAGLRLAGYKRPRSVVLLDEIPRLGSGKPDRRTLASLLPAPPAS